MRQSSFRLMIAQTLLLLAFSSQAGREGRDSYSIYLNKALILQQYVGTTTAVRLNLPTHTARRGDELIFHYSHCGVVGKGRKIIIKNDEEKVLKEWRYDDGAEVTMIIAVREILDLEKKHPGSGLHLYYASAELLPEGTKLALINPHTSAALRRSRQKV